MNDDVAWRRLKLEAAAALVDRLLDLGLSYDELVLMVARRKIARHPTHGAPDEPKNDPGSA